MEQRTLVLTSAAIAESLKAVDRNYALQTSERLRKLPVTMLANRLPRHYPSLLYSSRPREFDEKDNQNLNLSPSSRNPSIDDQETLK